MRDAVLRLAAGLPAMGAAPAGILSLTRQELDRLGPDLGQAIVIRSGTPPGLRVAARDPAGWEPGGPELSARLPSLTAGDEHGRVQELGPDGDTGRLVAVPLSFGKLLAGYWIVGGLPAAGLPSFAILDDWLLAVGHLLAPSAALVRASSSTADDAGPHAERLVHMGRFVAGIAHELGSPLQSVVSLAELLVRDPGRTDAVSCARRILRAALRCRGITEDLLTYARRGPPRLGPVRVQEAVLDALDLDPGSEEGIAGVELDDPGEVPPVTADARRLAQVFLNLIGNARQAIQARGDGRIRIRVDALPAAASGLRPEATGTVVRVAVEDDGPGIPPEIADRIFDPFFTTKDVGEGTGLGLSVSRTLVEDMGGRLWLDSGHAPGARFVVELPAATDGLSVATTSACCSWTTTGTSWTPTRRSSPSKASTSTPANGPDWPSNA